MKYELPQTEHNSVYSNRLGLTELIYVMGRHSVDVNCCFIYIYIYIYIYMDFPGGSVVKNPPAKA